ncbi:ABC transporter ATP-binding protein [Natroniella sp. ANB-PHB2]|uniref:ABC transporter ATP-binding protein n=1 Tax=Natroniella sp. ANB-PHB2 TaxID=3384444 RepID=UPI0038D4061C
MSLLELKGVTKRFGGITAVNKLDMEIEAGEIYGLIGPNGAGKSTAFNCISRYYEIDEGDIIFDGESILDKKSHQIVKLGISRTFQNVELFDNMNVLENFLVGQHNNFKTNIFSSLLMTDKALEEEKKAEEKAMEMLELLGIDHLAESKVVDQPYGIKKTIEIGRALMCDPKLLMLDEPVAGMNESETNKLAKLIKRISKEMDISILLVEHDMSMVMDICEEITVINFGKKIAEGDPEEIQNHPDVIKAYLGEEDVDA